jgi:protein SCO1/2
LRALLAAVLALALTACGLQHEETYRDVGGFVQSVDAANRQVTISHDEIPGFMPAMTMSFDVADAKLLEGVTPGARVAFDLRRSATLLSIESLRVLELPPEGGVALPPPLGEDEPAPDFALTDQDGRAVKLSDWRGRAVFLDFVFTRCPGPCPIQTARMVEVQKKLPPELMELARFASVSLDPAYDSPERLREYAEKHGASLENWSFLTGDPAVVQTVLDAYRIGTIRKPDGGIDHVVATFLVSPDGHVARRYLGLKGSAAAMVEDLQKIL